MEPENTTTPEAKQRKRFTRSRVLLGMVVLCLLLWSIKAIHHALQPKYQGKTAQEWFEEAKIIHTIHHIDVVPNDPGFLALTAMGTNAVWYVWHEYEREAGPATIWVMDIWRYYILGEKFSYADYLAERCDRAWILLSSMGQATECLVPELVDRVDGTDVMQSVVAANWLGNLKHNPSLSVPALIRALNQTPRIPTNNHSVYIRALGQFRSQAESALPLLMELHDSPAIKREEQLQLAAAIFQIDGSLPEPKYINRIFDPDDLKKSRYILFDSQIEHQPPTNAIPFLLNFSQGLTNEIHALLIKNAIRKIDPKAE